MVIAYNPGGINFGPGPNQPSKGGTNKKTAGSPGLLTSTGGLFGINGLLLVPIFNNTTGKSYVTIFDSSNFNCEDNAEYDFPQYIPQGHEGEDVTCHLAILKYRELGQVKFTLNITVYQRLTDTFVNYPFVINIPSVKLTGRRLQSFPDKRIHTLYISLSGVVGERPQPSITYNSNAGPLSITSLTICGNADQTKQM